MLKATEHTDDETMRWCWRKAKALTLTTAFMGNSICRYFLPNLTRPPAYLPDCVEGKPLGTLPKT
jgi:hypothetical protein